MQRRSALAAADESACSIGSNGSGALASTAALHKPELRLGQGSSALAESQRLARRAQLSDRHAVLGERAGLVGAQNGRRAQRLDRRRAAREHARARQYAMRPSP